MVLSAFVSSNIRVFFFSCFCACWFLCLDASFFCCSSCGVFGVLFFLLVFCASLVLRRFVFCAYNVYLFVMLC